MKLLPALAASVALLSGGVAVSGAATAQVAPAAAMPAPMPSAVTVPAPPVLTVGDVPVETMGSAAQADAEAFVSLARLSLETCGPIGDQPPANVQQQFSGALADYLAHRYARAISTSTTIVSVCAATQQSP